ncbi:MAG: hypothetical protein O6952_05290, partial [Planctomycetota bacterium]|nr:hypothetical protein [Planctomycetota bacterium]
MRRRRFLAVAAILAVVTTVFAIDMRILTLPSLVRLRIERGLISTFGFRGSFEDATADLDGTVRFRDLRLRHPANLYSIESEEVEARLSLSRFMLGRTSQRAMTFRRATLVWSRESGDDWDLRPFLHFCERLIASPIAKFRIEDLTLILEDRSSDESWTFRLDRVDVDLRGGGARLSGSSSHSPWRDLRFDLIADPARGELHGVIKAFNLRIRPQDLRLLPGWVADLVHRLRPRGTLDVEIHLRGNGRSEVRIFPANLSLRPEVFPYPLRKITTGLLIANASGIRIEQPLEGRSNTTRFQGTGRLSLQDQPGDEVLEFSWTGLQMNETLAAALPDDLEWAWRRARPSGTIDGSLTLKEVGASSGSVAVRVVMAPLDLDLSIPISLRGEARLRDTLSGLGGSVDGVSVEVAHLPLGAVSAGDVIIGASELRLQDLRGSSPAGSFRAGFRAQRGWPYEWSGELLLGREDLGSVLQMLTGGAGPDDGRWDVSLRGTGRERSSEGSGTIW